MGQSSWECSVCDQEVMHGRQPGYQKFTDAVIVWPNGDRRSGRYEEGYGNIAGVDLHEQHGGWRLIHQSCYDPSTPTDDLFASFKAKQQQSASDQGWWPGERMAIERYGQPDRSELTKDNTYVCYECNRTWEARWAGGKCAFGCVRPKDYRKPANYDETHDWAWSDRNEMVEPMRYISYAMEVADGVIVCHNEHQERPDWKRYHANREAFPDGAPTMVEPCFYAGEPQQARITKPTEWEDSFFGEEPKPFVVKCSGCKSDNVEIIALTRATI